MLTKTSLQYIVTESEIFNVAVSGNDVTAHSAQTCERKDVADFGHCVLPLVETRSLCAQSHTCSRVLMVPENVSESPG